MIRKKDICDKCGKEEICDVEEFACISEGTDKYADGKKIKEINTIKFITAITCRLCNGCAKKRRVRFLLFALLFLAASLPFFIWWMYIEFGFILLIGSVTALLLSGKNHEMEYIAQHHYRMFREGKEELIIHPKIITKTGWEEMVKNPERSNSKIII